MHTLCKEFSCRRKACFPSRLIPLEVFVTTHEFFHRQEVGGNICLIFPKASGEPRLTALGVIAYLVLVMRYLFSS
jgi:hypothetical protein